MAEGNYLFQLCVLTFAIGLAGLVIRVAGTVLDREEESKGHGSPHH
jgi:hypothetical protein